MARIVKGIFGGKSSSERILQRFNPTGFAGPSGTMAFDAASNRMVFSRSPERIKALEGLVGGFNQQAQAFAGLRGQVAPGLSRLTTDVESTLGQSLRERIASIRGEGRRTVGNIRENLARRRLAGSSFQESEAASAEAEFSRLEDQARAETGQQIAQQKAQAFLAEVDFNRDLISREFESSISGAAAVLSDLNMDTAMISQLSGLSSQLKADNLKAQAEARAAQEQAGEDFLGNLMGGLFAMFAGSDRRLKKDIRPLGTTPNGIAVYRYRYRWDDVEHVGVMADEVEHIPGAVVRDRHGYALVNYDKVLAHG